MQELEAGRRRNRSASAAGAEMRVVLLTAQRVVTVGRIPRPQVGHPRDVLLRMLYAGICGSDLHYFREGRIGDQKVRFPMVVGHEGVAEVAEVGDEVRTLRPGDKVVLDPAISCGSCDQCQVGRPHTCRSLRFLGSPGGPAGCMAEYVVLPEHCCHPLPAGVPFQHGVLAEPLSVALHALRLLGQHPPRSMAILGAGPVGLCLLAAAQRAGVRYLFVSDPLSWRREAALRMGAELALNPNLTDVVAEVLAAMPQGVDAVVECCGEQQALGQAVKMLAPGGTLAIVGIPRANRVRFDISTLRRKELRILNVRRQNKTLAEAVAMLPLETELVTHEYALAEAQRGFLAASEYLEGVIKSVICLA